MNHHERLGEYSPLEEDLLGNWSHQFFVHSSSAQELSSLSFLSHSQLASTALMTTQIRGCG